MSNSTKGSFLRSLAILASGSFLAQVIMFLSSPIMTRMYSASEIGQYTLVLTVIGMFGSVICARYDMAIVSEESEENVLPLIVLCSLCAVVLSCIITVGSVAYYLVQGYSLKQVMFNGIFIFILLLLNGASNILISYNNRCREYGVMTSVNLIRTVAKQVVMILGGKFAPIAGTLVVSEAVGTIFGVNKQVETLKRKTRRFKGFRDVTKLQVQNVAQKHKKQALFSTPALFASNFSYSSINLFINTLFGSAILGYYSLSYRLLGLPLNIISSNVSRVYLEEASREYQRAQSYRATFIRTSAMLVAIAIPMTAVLFILSPRLCSVFFGKDYYTAGVYLRYLAPMFGIRFVVSPLSVGMQISQKQNFELQFQCFFVLASVVSYIIAKVNAMTIENYLLIISILFSIIYLCFYTFLFTITQVNGGKKNG